MVQTLKMCEILAFLITLKPLFLSKLLLETKKNTHGNMVVAFYIFKYSQFTDRIVAHDMTTQIESNDIFGRLFIVGVFSRKLHRRLELLLKEGASKVKARTGFDGRGTF